MAETSRRDVSIVVPAYAEERRVGAAVRGLRDLAAGFPRLGEVLIVVEKSPDRTAEVARQAADGDPLVRVIERPVQRGKGAAVRAGMLQAAGEIIFFMDTDLSVPLRHVPVFVAWLDDNPGADAVIGNRRHAQSRITRRQHPLREAAGRCFNSVVRACGLSVSRDTQCGFKAFRRTAAREIFSRSRIDGFSFDTEILLLAAALGLRVDDLPVEWINDDDTRFRPVRDGWRSFADLLKVKRLVREAMAREGRG